MHLRPIALTAIILTALLGGAAVSLALPGSQPEEARPVPASMVFDPALGPACCTDAATPSTCTPPPSFADLEGCGAFDDVALCTWTEGDASDCAVLDLHCCDNLYGALWIDSCFPHSGGTLCDGWLTPIARHVD